MKKGFRIVLAASLIVTFFTPRALVQGSNCSDPAKIFSGSYNLVFEFDKKGDARVTQKVSLKNLVGDCVAKEYALRINSTKIKFLSGEDSQGNLIVEIKKDKTSTVINAKLNDFVIGKNKTVTFQLRYIIKDLAKKQGLIWSLTVPQIAASEKVSSYRLKLLVPANYGEIFTISPKPQNVKEEKKQTTVSYSKNKILNRTISASFGRNQEISFGFKTQLENKGFLSKKFFLPLPPDTQKQQILFTSIKPEPTKITIDEIGNYLAEYSLNGGKSIEISVKGVARIPGAGKNFASPLKISSDNLQELKNPNSHIQTQDRLIQEKAKELKTSEAIYDFVKNYLEYDTDAFESTDSDRRGAIETLSKKTRATNLDFVDLFVALAKAAGLPAREVFGPVLPNDKGFNPSFVGEPLNTKNIHVWAQVYDADETSWVNYDPTWANTSGVDYVGEEFSDRFILFISPGGEDINSLKNFSVHTDSVIIAGAKNKSNFSPKLDLKLSTDQAFAGFPVDLQIKLKNKSGVTLSNGEIVTKVENVDLLGKEKIEMEPLMPYETKTYRVKLRAGDIFKATRGKVTTTLNGKSGDKKVVLSKEKEVVVASFFSLGLQQILLVMLLTLLVIGFAAPKLHRVLKK